MGREGRLDKLADQSWCLLSVTTHGTPSLVLGLPQQAEVMLKTPPAKIQTSKA